MPLASIGSWDTTLLVKFIKDTLQRDPPMGLPKIGVDEALVSQLTVSDTIAFTKDPSFHTVGANGEPAFANSWAAAGGAYLAPAFWRDPLGFVHLRGRLASGTVGSAAFTLPPGYRPTGTVAFPVISNATIGQVEVAADGTVKPVSPSSNTYVSLDGITFSTK